MDSEKRFKHEPQIFICTLFFKFYPCVPYVVTKIYKIWECFIKHVHSVCDLSILRINVGETLFVDLKFRSCFSVGPFDISLNILLPMQQINWMKRSEISYKISKILKWSTLFSNRGLLYVLTPNQSLIYFVIRNYSYGVIRLNRHENTR